jgi:tyrosinase
MKGVNIQRRTLLKGAAVLAAGAQPGLSWPQVPARIRLEWQQFKATPQYASFLTAIGAMRSNPNPNDQASLQYWANAHMQYCPHGAPYFLSWHRGFLYYFEQQLRLSSGDPTLNLPYWDYYSYPTIPAEFTDPSNTNPLYRTRNGINVSGALDYSPFSPDVFNFQRGTINAFEPKLESAPHNPVHDLIGGVMTTMQSPLDPIFFVHHANIDRLTHAWALPDGKGIPYTPYPYSAATGSPYWDGNHVYGANLTIERYRTCDPTWLGYDYADDRMPGARPAGLVAGESLVIESPIPAAPGVRRPPAAPYVQLPPRQLTPGRVMLAGVANVRLSEHSTTAALALSAGGARTMEALVALLRQLPDAGVANASAQIRIVLDKLVVTALGKGGGFYYNLYLNMPAQLSALDRDRYFLGTLGAFQVSSASHHGPPVIDYPVNELLARQDTSDLRSLILSFARVDGDNAPRGEVLTIGEVRLELWSDMA